MAIYKISYANKGENNRIKFEHDAAQPLSHYEVVCLAARHKMQSEIFAVGLLAPASSPDLMVRTNVQIMDLARIEYVEFIIEGSTHIQCVPSVWTIGPSTYDESPASNRTSP